MQDWKGGVLGKEDSKKEDEIGSSVVRDEFNRALEGLSNCKALGLDNISGEILKTLQVIVTGSLCNKMYINREVSQDIELTCMVCFPKTSMLYEESHMVKKY